MSKVEDIGAKGVDALDLPEAAATALRNIHTEVADAYRESFFEMTETLKRQAAALNRIQTTLQILVERIAPELAQDNRVPIALSLAADTSDSDLARAVVVADPIGAGYMLSQSDLAKLLGLTSADVSILVRGFSLATHGELAVTVRSGEAYNMVNYHYRAVDRLRELIENPVGDLNKEMKQTLNRVRRKLKPGG